MLQMLCFMSCTLVFFPSSTLSLTKVHYDLKCAFGSFGMIASLFTYPIPDKHCFVGIFIGARATSHSLNTGHATWSNLIEIKGLELDAHIQTGSC